MTFDLTRFYPLCLLCLQHRREMQQRRSAAEAYRAEIEKSRATDGHPVDVYVVLTNQQDKELVRPHVERASSNFKVGRPPNTCVLVMYRPTIESALRDLGAGKESIFAVILHTCTPSPFSALDTIAEMWPPAVLLCAMARERIAEHRTRMIAALETFKRTGEKQTESFLIMPMIVQCQHADKTACRSCGQGPDRILSVSIVTKDLGPL